MVNEFLSEFAKLVVEFPKEISVVSEQQDNIVNITLFANKIDIGKLIGREGKMINSLKTIISGCQAQNHIIYKITITSK